MEKKKLIELGKKLGMKEENIEYGLKEKPKETENAILEATKFMEGK